MSSSETVLFKRRLDWIILAAVNIAVPVTTIWKYHAGDTNSKVALVSGVISLLACNSVVLLAFRKRLDREDTPLPKTLIVGAVALVALSCLVTILGVSSVSHHDEYMDLALSDIPLGNIEPERKRLVVELIRRTAANSREENNTLAEVQKVPMKPSVYSPESFADRRVIESTMTQLRKYADIDLQYFDKQQSAREEFRQKMAASDPGYLRDWDAKRQSQEALEAATEQLERNWLSDVQSLYDYAAEHLQDISVKDGQIIISDAVVRQEFDERLERSKALNHKLQTYVQEEAMRQQKSNASLGLN